MAVGGGGARKGSGVGAEGGDGARVGDEAVDVVVLDVDHGDLAPAEARILLKLLLQNLDARRLGALDAVHDWLLLYVDEYQSANYFARAHDTARHDT